MKQIIGILFIVMALLIAGCQVRTTCVEDDVCTVEEKVVGNCNDCKNKDLNQAYDETKTQIVDEVKEDITEDITGIVDEKFDEKAKSTLTSQVSLSVGTEAVRALTLKNDFYVKMTGYATVCDDSSPNYKVVPATATISVQGESASINQAGTVTLGGLTFEVTSITFPATKKANVYPTVKIAGSSNYPFKEITLGIDEKTVTVNKKAYLVSLEPEYTLAQTICPDSKMSSANLTVTTLVNNKNTETKMKIDTTKVPTTAVTAANANLKITSTDLKNGKVTVEITDR